MNMNREEFLHKLSGGLAATCVACMAAACSSESPGPISPATGSNPSGNTAGTTVNLDSELKKTALFESFKMFEALHYVTLYLHFQ